MVTDFLGYGEMEWRNRTYPSGLRANLGDHCTPDPGRIVISGIQTQIQLASHNDDPGLASIHCQNQRVSFPWRSTSTSRVRQAFPPRTMAGCISSQTGLLPLLFEELFFYLCPLKRHTDYTQIPRRIFSNHHESPSRRQCTLDHIPLPCGAPPADVQPGRSVSVNYRPTPRRHG